MKKWILISVGIFVFGLIGTAGYFGYRSSHNLATPVAEPPTVPVETGDVVQSVTAPGSLSDVGETKLQPLADAVVETIDVHAGDRVNAGQTLMTLGSKEKYEAAVAELRIKVLEAQAALEKQKSDLPAAEAQATLTAAQAAYDQAKAQRESKQYARASNETIDVARARLALANEAASDAEGFYDLFDDRPEDDLERAEALSQLARAHQEQNLALGNLNYLLAMPGKQELASADAALELAKAQLDASQKNVDSLGKDGGVPLALAEAQLTDAKAALAEAEANLAGLTIKAPFDGIVTSIDAKVGQSVTSGSTLLVLYDPKSIMAETTVVEEDYPLVEPGQTAELYIDAMPEEKLTGKVSRVIPKRAASDRALYTLFIALDQIPEKAAPGMTVDASIVIDKQVNVLRLPRSIVHARSDGTATVEVWVNGHSEERSVKVGLRGDSYVEIKSGLKAGEKVISK
jgi:HlyD family secretion protein